MQRAVGRDDALWDHAGDRLGDELDVRALQRRQVVRAEQHALAAEGVVRPRLPAQLGVFQLRAHERRRAQAGEAPDRARVADRRGDRLAVLEHELAAELLHAGDAFDRRPGQRAGSGGCCAAETSCPCAGRPSAARPARATSGTNCTALAPVPTTATRLPASVVVIPASGVKAVTGERLDAVDRRVGRLVSCPVASTSASAS